MSTLAKLDRGLALVEASADGVLPSEFRIFAAGINKSTKGDYLYTPESEALVMQCFAAEGVDLPIDLNHDMVTDEPMIARADAGDARGWFRPEPRSGELWAIGVTWTPDGADRLTCKKQRYISPCFLHDDTGLIVQLINVAICARPAFLNAPPLVAAKKSTCAFDAVDRKYISTIADPRVRAKLWKAFTDGSYQTKSGNRSAKK